jgi:uncharacterized alkaline shock family protein YloU
MLVKLTTQYGDVDISLAVVNIIAKISSTEIQNIYLINMNQLMKWYFFLEMYETVLVKDVSI